MVSVIVPVYNVEEYLDKCIESIVNQTYKDLEILLINDGSTDRSRDICLLWASKDARIRVINKVNEGQAVCRNLGLYEAKGEYITFVDSDDWIYEDMIELLLNAIKNVNADIAVCDAYVELPGGKVSDFSLQDLGKNALIIRENPEFIVSVRYTMWGKLYNKRFLMLNKIEQPAMKFEDFAIIPIIFALSEKVACVNRRLYYYRYRESSTIHRMDFIDDRFKAIDYLIDSFKERGMFEEWKNILQRIVTERAIVLMRQIYPLLNKYYKACYERYDEILKKNFELDLMTINSHYSSYYRTGRIDANIFGSYNLCVIGSYNLMIVAKMMMQVGTPEFLENHYSFSNIVSMMSDTCTEMYRIDLSHKSEYRQKHLIQDFTKRLKNKNRCEFNDIDYILIDFLEERFDIGRIGNSYFTVSDAFQEISDKLEIEYEILGMDSSEAWDLWEKSCDRLIELLKSYVQIDNVILVKNYLAEHILGEDENLITFANIHEIRLINESLERKYNYFIEHAQGVIVWETENDCYYYTDSNFKHGCYPWHLNNKEYCAISQCLMNLLRDEQTKTIRSK